LGIHYPTDIVAAALIGIAMAFWIKLSPLRTALARPFLRWEEIHPGLFYPLFFLVAFEVSEMFGSLRAIARLGLLAAKRSAGQ
jgi:hypothetical protein